jgi:hypothetical protein
MARKLMKDIRPGEMFWDDDWGPVMRTSRDVYPRLGDELSKLPNMEFVVMTAGDVGHGDPGRVIAFWYLESPYDTRKLEVAHIGACRSLNDYEAFRHLVLATN